MITNIQQAIYTTDQLIQIISDLTSQVNSSIKEVHKNKEGILMMKGASIMSESIISTIRSYQSTLLEEINKNKYDT